MKGRLVPIEAGMKVRANACDSCPFEGRHPIDLTPERREEIFANILNFEGSQICHTDNNRTICRGGRELTKRLACARGAMKGTTDEEFDLCLQAEIAERLRKERAESEGDE